MKTNQPHRHINQNRSQPHHEIKQGDRLLSSIEVAEIIGKSTAWLARKRWEGDGIPYRKIGRHVRYQESVVMEWLNSQPQLSSTSE
jgi:predicted DNA-binding transcriptional regulator AlpA